MNDFRNDISEEENDIQPTIYATIFSDNRGSVKLRETPMISCARYDALPFGSIVEVTEYGPEWSRVNYKSRQGWYVMTKFLLIDEDSIPNIGGTEDWSI